MTEEKMEKAMLCEEELDQVAGGVYRGSPILNSSRNMLNTAALDSEEVEKLMGDSDQSKMEYEARR